MINTANLSLQQAPPISIPFRFFLTAPFFAIAAAIQFFYAGEQILLSRWLPVALSFTHLLTLGFLAMIMCGAMLQMLPVMAGAPVANVTFVGGGTHLLLSLGTISLVAWFLGFGSLVLPMLFLGAGFSLFFIAVANALWRRGKVPRDTPIKGMRLAIIALAVTITVGSLLALGYKGLIPLIDLAVVTDIHLGWGIAGWIGLLLVSVAFQLVPMFNVTAEYPLWIKVHLPKAIFSALIGWSLLKASADFLDGDNLATALLVFVAAAYLLFAWVTLKLQLTRKRKVPDVTLMFWIAGLLSLIGCAGIWIGYLVYPPLAEWVAIDVLIGIGLLMGFAISIINGMLYKIVPFLSWFHLQNRQIALMDMSMTVPHMKAFISDSAAKAQFVLHLIALLLMFSAAFFPAWFTKVAALLFLASNLMLARNLWSAVWKYRRYFQLIGADN